MTRTLAPRRPKASRSDRGRRVFDDWDDVDFAEPRLGAFEQKLRVDKQKAAVIQALDRRRPDTAARFVDELVREQIGAGHSDLAAKSLCDLATHAEDRGYPGLVTQWLESAVSLNASDPVAWSQFIRFRRRSGQTRELLEWTAQMRCRFPNNVYAYTARGEVLRAEGRLREACDVYDRAVQLFPGNVFARNSRAVTLKGLGRLEQALVAFDETLALAPDDEFARTGRAGVLKALGWLDESKRAYDDAFVRYPDRPWVRNWRAELLKQLGDLGESLAAYRLTCKMFPDHVLSRNGLVGALLALGRVDEARIETAETRRRFPDDLYVRTAEAAFLAATGELDASRVILEALRVRSPRDEHVRTALGIVLLRVDAFAPAERLLFDRRPPTEARDWFRLLAFGLLQLRRGDMDEAEATFTRGVEFCPFARHKLRFECARALARMQRGDPLRVAKSLLALPETPDALVGLTRRLFAAHALFEGERAEEARRCLETPTAFRHPCVVAIERELRAHDGTPSERPALSLAAAERLWDAELELLTI